MGHDTTPGKLAKVLKNRLNGRTDRPGGAVGGEDQPCGFRLTLRGQLEAAGWILAAAGAAGMARYVVGSIISQIGNWKIGNLDHHLRV